MLSSGESTRSSNTPKGSPIRISTIKGYSNRSNNIIYCPPLVRTTSKDECTAVVYFGGDVQDVPEKMETNRDNKNYIKWNLENTAVILRESFPKSHIVVVRPVRMEYSTFSCYDNFVRGNNAGIPDHTPMHFALQHLEEILINLTKKLLKPIPECEIAGMKLSATPAQQSTNSDNAQDMDIDILQVQETVTVDSEDPIVFPIKDDACNTLPTIPIPTDLTSNLLNAEIQTAISSAPLNTIKKQPANNSTEPNESLWWRENLNLDKANLKLIGFSKGCVVLNQFIYEFHYLKTLTPDDSTMMRLVSRIKDMFWLDGGHGGGKNTWITSRSLLETLCRLGINIHVHVTPYQIQDDHRPWIRKEEKAFTDLLKRLGGSLSRFFYPCDISTTNLFTHFEVLNHFRQHQIQLLAQSHIQQQTLVSIAAQSIQPELSSSPSATTSANVISTLQCSPESQPDASKLPSSNEVEENASEK